MCEKITELSRSCIAFPTAWDAKTDNERELYIRYRSGYLTVREMGEDLSEREFREQIGESSLEGHITVYDMIECLENSGKYEVDVDYPEKFYDYYFNECSFICFPPINKIYCTDCSWKLDEEDMEEIEYEKVLPPKCLNCGSSDIKIDDRLKERMEELSDLADNFD